jgi:hypothetical protein
MQYEEERLRQIISLGRGPAELRTMLQAVTQEEEVIFRLADGSEIRASSESEVRIALWERFHWGSQPAMLPVSKVFADETPVPKGAAP